MQLAEMFHAMLTNILFEDILVCIMKPLSGQNTLHFA